MTGVYNTSGKFITGVSNTGDKIMTVFNDTGNKSLNKNIHNKAHKNSKWLLPNNQGPGRN